MFNWLKQEPKQMVIEVDKSVAKLAPLTEDLKASIKSLEYHPGHRWLMSRLALEKAALEKYLHEGFTLSEQQLHHLQAGVHYLSYLESEIKRLFASPAPVAREAMDLEREAFDRIHSTVSLVE